MEHDSAQLVAPIRKHDTVRNLFAIVGVVAVIALIGAVVLGSLNSARSTLSSVGEALPGAPMYDSAFDQSENSQYRGDYGESAKTSGSGYAPEEVLAESVANTASLRQIIRTGSMTIVAEDTEVALESIATQAETLGGYVERRTLNEISDKRKRGTITVRVPSDRFDETVAVIRGASVQVVHEDVNTQDVTDQMVDLDARLRNERAQEERYLEILERADEIEDILMVESRLSQTRTNIERMVAQMENYKRRVAFSSIAVTVTSEADVEVLGVVWSPLVQVKLAFNRMIEDLTAYIDAMIAFAFALPVILVWIVTVLVGGGVVWKLFHVVRSRVLHTRHGVRRTE